MYIASCCLAFWKGTELSQHISKNTEYNHDALRKVFLQLVTNNYSSATGQWPKRSQFLTSDALSTKVT